MTPTAPRRSNRRAGHLPAVLLAAGLVALTACSSGAAATATTPPPTPEPTTTEPETTVPETTATTTTTVAPTTEAPTTTVAPEIPRMPLTGAPLGPGETAPDRPALAVKIDNVDCAHRTQQGLNQAD